MLALTNNERRVFIETIVTEAAKMSVRAWPTSLALLAMTLPTAAFAATRVTRPPAVSTGAKVPLSSGECTQLGGKVVFDWMDICAHGYPICITKDQNGKIHRVCINE